MSYRVTLTLRDVNNVERYVQYSVMSMWEIKRLQRMVGCKWNDDEVIEMEWNRTEEE